MILEKGQISSAQLFFLVNCFIQGALLPLNFAYPISKHDTWLAVIAAMIIGSVIALVYISLAGLFPGQNLVQINDLIYGPYLGKFISLQYILFFLMTLSGYLWFISDFVLTFIMPETPISSIMIMFSFICAWAVRQGIEVITRMSVVFSVIPASIVFITFALLLKDMEFTNLLPLFESPPGDLFQSTHIIMHISFSQVLVFLMVIPYVNKQGPSKTPILLGMLSGGMVILVSSIRNIAALGPLSGIVTSPSLEAVRLINIGKILTRLEILVAMAEILLLFIISCVFYYATVLGLAHISKLRTYVPLVVPIGILSIILSLLSYESRMQVSHSIMYITPIVSLYFYIVLPFMSLIVAKLRKLPRNKGRN
ncbi:GerAB/ArcD/ProY family transporter [Desulfosporosinus hippei]|uniref:Spore germination protein KB n=1 Tax=Desulfosporosinus hippei DSM 8344 TaxID=1121419 RepID=A0A1G8G5M1_9FIRM|nr:endospore germination permease [Desulfosporosinus hippei]SDH89655.1 spore germination protein KB [Desulfosporosinus hippei DSM 8344]